MDGAAGSVRRMQVEVVVHRRAWQTIRDAPGEYRVRHFARFKVKGGPEIRSVRISGSTADWLIDLGARFEDDPLLAGVA